MFKIILNVVQCYSLLVFVNVVQSLPRPKIGVLGQNFAAPPNGGDFSPTPPQSVYDVCEIIAHTFMF